MAALVVEVNFRNRTAPQYIKIEQFPFRIGRAYDNDLILADDTISAHHLQIEQNESGYLIKNLSSENGTWDGDRQLGSEPEPLMTPKKFAIGHLELRFLSSDSPIAPTRTQISLTRLSTICMDIRVALSLLAVYFAFDIWLTLEQQAVGREWLEILMDEILSLLMPLGLATITGFLSRLLLHHWRFPLQLSIASLVFIANSSLPELTHFVNYVYTSDIIAEIFNTVLFVAGACVLLAWQLRAVSGMTRGRSALTSVIILIPIFILLNLRTYLTKPEFSNQPDMHTLLQSNDVRFAATYSDLDEFKGDVMQILEQGIQSELQRAKQRKMKKRRGETASDRPEGDSGEES